MRSIVLYWLCVGLVGLLSDVPAAPITVSDQMLGMTLELPTGFVARPDIPGAVPACVYAYQYGDAADSHDQVLLAIEKLGSVISPGPMEVRDQLPGQQFDNFSAEWQRLPLQGVKVSESLGGQQVVSYLLPIPLRRQAIQIRLLGSAERSKELDVLLRQVLDGLRGETDWIATARGPIISGNRYTQQISMLAIGATIIGLIGLWWISSRTVKGTVLAIAALLYIASWPVHKFGLFEMRMLAGAMRLVGMCGAILGIVDLLRKRGSQAADGKLESPPG